LVVAGVKRRVAQCALVVKQASELNVNIQKHSIYLLLEFVDAKSEQSHGDKWINESQNSDPTQPEMSEEQSTKTRIKNSPSARVDGQNKRNKK